MNGVVLNALADPFGGLPNNTGFIANTNGSTPAGNPVASATGPRLGFLGDLRRLYHPDSPLTWFAVAGVVTFTLIAVSHGHLGGEASAHVGPAHVDAGVGSGGD